MIKYVILHACNRIHYTNKYNNDLLNLLVLDSLFLAIAVEEELDE